MIEITSQSALTFLLPVSLAIVSYVVFRSKKLPAPYPPGPPPKPIIGNAFDIPFKKPWVKYMQLGKQFNSGIIHLSVMNTHIVVLHAIEDITELLERRSAKYSSRMPSPIFPLVGMENFTPFLLYGDALRKQRRILDEGMKKDMIPSYHHIQGEKVHLFLDQLLRDPTEIKEHCISITMGMAFGYDLVPGHKDQYVELADFVIDTTQGLILPGRTLIPVFPFLKHIPTWFPGAFTQRLCARVKKASVEYRNRPFEFVKTNMATGSSKHCVLQQLIENHTDDSGFCKDEETIKNAMAGLYIGGVDTMPTTKIDFILAMTLHPDAQKKAHEEIDCVIGKDRLPTLDDRSSLPYVEAVYREVLRWRPVTPFGFPHSTDEDDIYKGLYIPKGAIVMPNIWAITRNEERYPEPELFRPERYFTEEGTLNKDTVTSYAFGFGRRHLADTAMWLMMASVLATFNVSKARDEHGNEIDVDDQAFTDTLAMHPLPFKCSITSRSQQAESLVREAAFAANCQI
ncbi:Cytochrome P450 [Amanita muscaria]